MNRADIIELADKYMLVYEQEKLSLKQRDCPVSDEDESGQWVVGGMFNSIAELQEAQDTDPEIKGCRFRTYGVFALDVNSDADAQGKKPKPKAWLTAESAIERAYGIHGRHSPVEVRRARRTALVLLETQACWFARGLEGHPSPVLDEMHAELERLKQWSDAE